MKSYNLALKLTNLKMMKKFFVLIIVASFAASCGPEPDDPILDYTIRNKSEHNVKLKIFDLFIQESNVHCDTTILLEQNSEVVFQYKFLSYYDGAFGPASDSVYIIFDDTKQIVYKRNDEYFRNIYDINNWEGGNVNDELYEYLYIITDVDYDNAVLIE